MKTSQTDRLAVRKREDKTSQTHRLTTRESDDKKSQTDRKTGHLTKDNHGEDKDSIRNHSGKVLD